MKVVIPMKAESTSNLREHPMARHRRVKPQRDAATLLVKSKVRELGSTRLVVLMTRVSPRELDDDNLRGALKSFRDGVARALKVDDKTPLVRWDYAQRQGSEPHQHEVEIVLTWEVPA